MIGRRKREREIECQNHGCQDRKLDLDLVLHHTSTELTTMVSYFEIVRSLRFSIPQRSLVGSRF